MTKVLNYLLKESLEVSVHHLIALVMNIIKIFMYAIIFYKINKKMIKMIQQRIQ
jgi:hypothetical protein